MRNGDDNKATGSLDPEIDCTFYNNPKTMNPGGMWKDRIITKNIDGTRDLARDIAVARKCPLRECTTDADCSARGCED